ncbi:hypothetical protein ABZ876_13575 [Streptomyces sp. NPDC046931]|uniref:hypothetical protein n=1 Tax=Streptomyces sp. NPDC046931 TaxID=3154806 RepID=UPI0033E2A8BD
MTFGLMRKAGAVAAVSAAMLAFTVSTADASALDGRDAARSSAPAVLQAGGFDGKWIMDQSNAPHVSLFLGTPNGDGNFTGFASWEGNSGDIDGKLSGGNVVFFIHWNFGHTALVRRTPRLGQQVVRRDRRHQRPVKPGHLGCPPGVGLPGPSRRRNAAVPLSAPCVSAVMGPQ